MSASPRIIIVGGGISGLSLAYRLQVRLPNADITLLEQAERPGGTTWTLREEGFQVEMGPNGFLDTKPATLELCKSVDLGSQLVQATEAAAKNRYLFLGDRLKALPGGIGAFLKTDLLSWRGKVSLLWERFRKKRSEPGDESIDAFARRRAGDEAADLFAAAARKRKAEAKAHGVPAERPGKMWSLPGGLRVLIEALTARLKRAPNYGVEIRSLEKTGDLRKPTWRIRADGQESWEADAVVLTCPAYRQATIVSGLDAGLAEDIGGIAYNRVAVVALGYRQADVPMPLDGFGFIAPQRTRRDLLGVQWCSSIYPGRAPVGHALLRAMCGGWHRADMVDWDDARLLQAIRAELRIAMGIQAPPIFHKIVRWHKAIPQYHLGHLERVARIERRLEQHPGLWLGGNAYHGVALNDCTERGLVLAESVQSFCAPNDRPFTNRR
jgi:oxygen-dependent protoporphyrinogen oxidase